MDNIYKATYNKWEFLLFLKYIMFYYLGMKGYLSNQKSMFAQFGRFNAPYTKVYCSLLKNICIILIFWFQIKLTSKVEASAPMKFQSKSEKKYNVVDVVVVVVVVVVAVVVFGLNFEKFEQGSFR